MSDEIPEDIRAQARWVYDRLGRGSAADEDTIARAILAERERCAKIADACFADIKDYPHDFGSLDNGGLRAAEKIAQAIRSSHE